MSRCFIWFPIVGLGEPNIYQNMGDFTRKWWFYLEGVESEELSGGLLTGDDGIGFSIYPVNGNAIIIYQYFYQHDLFYFLLALWTYFNHYILWDTTSNLCEE